VIARTRRRIPTDCTTATYATNVSAVTLLQETNIQRSGNSLSAFTMNNQLTAAAQAKANDMAAKNYWSHVTPEGVQPWQFISDAGYVYVIAAENLAYGFDSSAGAVAGWMNSPGHRANILNGELRDIGFGIANSASYQNNGEQTIIVAMYGKPQAVVTPNTAQYGNSPTVSAKVAGPTSTPPPVAPREPEATPSTAESTPAPTAEESDVVTPKPNAETQKTATLQARDVSRIDLLASGNAQWAVLALVTITTVCIIIFFARHLRLWHKLLVRGEAFVIHHPFLDIAMVATVVVAYILTQTSGFIH
jgi:hypothetical protein